MTERSTRLQAWHELHAAAITLRHYGMAGLADQVDHAAADISRAGRVAPDSDQQHNRTD